MPNQEVDEVVATAMDRLRGKTCGFLESLGLNEKQERAAITTFKSLTYDAQKELLENLSD